MGVFRAIMVLTGVTVFMPAPSEDRISGPNAAATETVSVISAASRTVSDVALFCGRQPGVCETAGYVVAKLEAKAKYGARLIYEWASESNGEPAASPFNNQAASDPIATGSVVAAAAQNSSSTLQIEDLIPRWRSPLPPHRG